MAGVTFLLAATPHVTISGNTCYLNAGKCILGTIDHLTIVFVSTGSKPRPGLKFGGFSDILFRLAVL